MMALVGDPIIQKRSFRDLPLANKRVLVRVDYNVPIKDGVVIDDARIRASLPTLEHLIRKKAKIILISHLGRPKGQVNPKYSLEPLVEPLRKLTKVPVHFANNCIGTTAFDAVAKLKEGEILLLENLRFHLEEEKNNSIFGKELASLGDFFVQDAFGSVHRAHASTAQVPKALESSAGALLGKELKFLSQVRTSPAKPYVAVLGGAKVSDKIGVVEAFLDQVSSLFIGGAMAYTFLKAQGIEIGDSRLDEPSLSFCQTVLEKAKDKNISLLLPQDHLIVKDIENPDDATITEGPSIPAGWKGVDIGPRTVQSLKPVLAQAKTIFWNGPAGIFEMDPYAKGTLRLAQMIAEAAQKGAMAIVGGGDSVAAVAKADLSDKMTYISTGGGASLEFLEGKDLPGVAALPNG